MKFGTCDFCENPFTVSVSKCVEQAKPDGSVKLIPTEVMRVCDNHRNMLSVALPATSQVSV